MRAGQSVCLRVRRVRACVSTIKIYDDVFSTRRRMDGVGKRLSEVRARAHRPPTGNPARILSRRFRRPTETRRRRRDRGDDGGFKNKIISIHSRRHRFRSSTRYRSRDARTRVSRSAASQPPRFSPTYHEATLAHGTRLHRDGVGRAGIGGVEGFNVVLFVRHDDKCVEVQSDGRGTRTHPPESRLASLSVRFPFRSVFVFR